MLVGTQGVALCWVAQIPEEWIRVPCFEVSKLPEGTTDDDVKGLLAAFGEVKSVVLQRPTSALARIKPGEGSSPTFPRCSVASTHSSPALLTH